MRLILNILSGNCLPKPGGAQKGEVHYTYISTLLFFYYIWLDVCMMYEPYARFQSELVVMMIISISISYTTANVRLILTI